MCYKHLETITVDIFPAINVNATEKPLNAAKTEALMAHSSLELFQGAGLGGQVLRDLLDGRYDILERPEGVKGTAVEPNQVVFCRLRP